LIFGLHFFILTVRWNIMIIVFMGISMRGNKSIVDYDEQLGRRLIEKVTIYKDKVAVEFKSGVMVGMEI
jgi:hypothetical protein